MWSPRLKRHSYLVKSVSAITDYNPRVTARLMDKTLEMHTTYRNLEPPLLPLATAMPLIYPSNVDALRSKHAFDRWALPKLKKELHYDDIFVVMRALNTIHDLVHNPEKAFEAIRVGLIESLGGMMLHERDFVREKICMILCTIAGIEAGKRAIIRRYKILHHIAMLLEDRVDTVRYKAQLLLKELSFSPIEATALGCAEFTPLLLRLISGSPKTENDDVLILHMSTMKDLLDRDIKLEVFKYNGMDIFIEKIDHPRKEVKTLALDCLLLLLQHPQGKQLAIEKKLNTILLNTLLDCTLEMKVKIIGLLAFSTLVTESRSEVAKVWVVACAVEILENFNNSEGQLMASKLLCNLFKDSEGRCTVKSFRERIYNFLPANDDVKRHKNILINLIKKK